MSTFSLLKLVGFAAVLLSLYHLVLQQLTSATARTAPNARCHSARPVPASSASADESQRRPVDESRSPPAEEHQRLPEDGLNKRWYPPQQSHLMANEAASQLFATAPLSSTTLHFTFGSLSMIDFLHNWRHHVLKLGLSPAVVGAADAQMFQECNRLGIAALGMKENLNVWTYELTNASTTTVVQSGKSEWKYYRHHKSSFLELGLVKAAFLWELTLIGYDVLISDLDVVWLADGWERWMTYRHPSRPPLPEASMQAMADVLVSTDELDEEYDAHGRWERWPFGVGWGWRTDLNTGVVFFRATNGTKAFLQAWRLAMLAKREVEHTNDQFVFCAMVREAGMESVSSSAAHMSAWRETLAAHGLLREDVLAKITPSTRGVSISKSGFNLATPCLPEARCAPARFTLGTLPLRAFTGGHTFFMQRVQNFEGHKLTRASPLTVHFTFQYSDTPDFPHGKRQRAREAGVWAVDPPSYFTEGRYIKLVGPLYTAAQRVAIERRWPEWSPQRHMALDAIQRATVRDLLALSIATNTTLIMPPLFCFCDRYWGFTQNCRMPTAPEDMPMPYRCSQDAFFEIKFWNDKQVRFREPEFLDHPLVPQQVRDAVVRVVVHSSAPQPAAHSAEAAFTAVLRPGTPMSDVRQAIDATNPHARVIEIGATDIRRLCRWMGTSEANVQFNNLARYVLHESSRYCPSEDHDEQVANIPNWNWRNPFTAYNCTWGFASPTDFPEPPAGAPAPCAKGAAGVSIVELLNSTTCPRVMLCDEPCSNLAPPDGGLDYDTFGNATAAALRAMPGGRCPYPTGDVALVKKAK